MDTPTLFRRSAPLLVSGLCLTATALANGSTAEATHDFPILGQPTAQPVAAAEYGWSYQPGTGLTYASADGGNKISFNGRIMNDWAFMSADDGPKSLGAAATPPNPFVDGTEFRRAWIESSGTLYDKVTFKASYEMASSSPGFRDVWIGINDVLGSTDFRVGGQKEPFSLEEITSSKYITFMERSVANSMVPGYQSGAMLHDHYAGSKVSYGIGVFRQTNGAAASSQQKDGAYNVTGRVTWAPMHNEDATEVLHVGAGASMRKPESGAGRVRTRPEAHMAPYVIDSGSVMTDEVMQYGGEVAWVGGPLSVQAEYIMQTIAGLAGAPDVDTTGYYAFVSWFLTGEHRPYQASDGSFGRVKPKGNYGQGGSGAWELALRYSSLDVDAPAIATAGEVSDITAGVNWYLNPNTRVMFNYILGDLDSNTDSFDGDMNIFMMRFQVDF